MTRAEDLLKALNGLQGAADNELSGEAHRAASKHIKELFQLAGFDGEDVGEGGSEPAIAFTEALAEVRAQAEGELSGTAFYIASKTLDDLGNLSSEVVPSDVAFDDLSAVSKARVEEVAASLGVEFVHHGEPPLHDHHEVHEYEDPLAGAELEKRSSEPCSMPEITPIAVETVTVVEAASAREVAEATHDFGTLAIEAQGVSKYGEPYGEPENKPAQESLAKIEPVVDRVPEKQVAAAPEAVAKPDVAIAAPATESSSHPAAKKIETKPREHPKEEQKTFFSLWLDMVFGRKK